MNRQYPFSSESVSDGHPDKLADRISDTILDAFLVEDSNAKVACETFIANNLVVVAGEFNSTRRGLLEQIQQVASELVRQALMRSHGSE